MERAVIISIKGSQRFDFSQPDALELVTQGQLTKSEDELLLSYQESAVTGLEDTLTTFQIEPERITLMRIGEFNSQMVFEQGRRHLSVYNTPFGSMAIGVHTLHLMCDLTPEGGQIEIDYIVEIDHAIAGRHTFQINVKPVQVTS